MAALAAGEAGSSVRICNGAPRTTCTAGKMTVAISCPVVWPLTSNALSDADQDVQDARVTTGQRPRANREPRERLDAAVGSLDVGSSMIYVWWRGLDLNQRRRAPTDLQSVPFSHSGTPPRRVTASIANCRRCQRIAAAMNALISSAVGKLP